MSKHSLNKPINESIFYLIQDYLVRVIFSFSSREELCHITTSIAYILFPPLTLSLICSVHIVVLTLLCSKMNNGNRNDFVPALLNQWLPRQTEVSTGHGMCAQWSHLWGQQRRQALHPIFRVVEGYSGWVQPRQKPRELGRDRRDRGRKPSVKARAPWTWHALIEYFLLDLLSSSFISTIYSLLAWTIKLS